MPELTDLPDLARDVSERVVTPPYDAVSRRVRARRLRGAAGTLAAAVLVVGGVAIWQSAATTAGPPVPQPAERTPLPPSDESLWREVVEGPDAHPFEIEGTEDGSIAVVWRALLQPEPTFALVIRESDGTVHGRRLDAPVDLTPVPGGWVGVRTAQAWFIASGGQWTPLDEPAAPREARSGDVFVDGQYAHWLYSPDERELAAASGLSGSDDGYVTPDGRLMTCRWNGRDEILFSAFGARSSKMRPGVPGQSCVIAGRGDGFAIVGLGDEPDGNIPMTGLMTQVGLTWHYPRMTDPLGGVTSVVMTPGGSTVITNASDGRWFLVRPDGAVTEPDLKVGEAFVSGERLYLTSYGFVNGPLYYSDDEGQTWSEAVLPGNDG